MLDILGQPLNIGDDVIFAYYKGAGSLHMGTIFAIGKEKVVITPYYILCGKRYYEENIRRRIPIQFTYSYLLKINTK